MWAHQGGMEADTESAAAGWLQEKGIRVLVRETATGSPAMPSLVASPEQSTEPLVQVPAVVDTEPPPAAQEVPEADPERLPAVREDPGAVLRALRLEDTAALAAVVKRVPATDKASF